MSCLCRYRTGMVICMNKRVCIIRSNPVRPDSRVEKEALALVNAGYRVHILAWDRDSNHAEKKEKIVVGNREIPITRLGYKAAYAEGMRSIIPYLKFQFHMRKWLRQHSSEYDIIHACDFHTAFFSLKYGKKKKFVFDIFDFVFGDPKNTFQRIVKKAQIRIVNKSDATIVCTEDRKEQISEAKPKRLEVIHNTPSTEQLKIDSGLIFKSKTDRIKIAYVGILTDERMLTDIGNYVSCSRNIELHIAGFGQLESFFDRLASTYDNIFWYGRIPYEQTLDLESKCDVMMAIYDPSIDNCRLAAPNKFYESLMLGKPVIMVKETGMSDVVVQNDIGVLIDFSKKGFEKGLKELIDRKQEWQAMSIRMQELYVERFSWKEMERRLIDLYAGL